SAFELLLFISIHQKSKRDAVNAAGRFDDVRRDVLVGGRIEIGLLQHSMLVCKERSVLERRPSAFGMTRQIIVRAVGDTLDLIELFSFFALGKESIEKVRCCFGIMRK